MFGITLLIDAGTMSVLSFVPARSPATTPLPIPATPSFAGLDLFAQSAHFEGCGLTASAGLRITIL